MSEENKGVLATERKSEPTTTSTTEPKKFFTRRDVKRYVPISLYFPTLYPDYEPISFKFKLALSSEVEKQKESYLALSATEQTKDEFKQALDEVCDLLIELPEGFGDLTEVKGEPPATTFRRYVEETTDPDALFFLKKIVVGADGQYWNTIFPRLFRR